MKAERDLAVAEAKARELDNVVRTFNNERLDERYKYEIAQLKQNLEAQGLSMESMGITMKGQELENKLKEVQVAYSERMANAELENLLKRNGLLGEQISGELLNNALKEYRVLFESETIGSQISSMQNQAVVDLLNSEQMRKQFADMNQYREFKRKVWDDLELSTKGFQPMARVRAAMNMALLTLMEATGANPGGGQSIMNFLK